MKLRISDDIKIFTIQEEFNTAFPYLKLEFFSKSHKTGAGTAKKFIQENSKTLKQCQTKQNTNNSSITITPNMTVTNLEQLFHDLYGLEVQVFRKSGKTWLETTVTDGWTLEEQNRQGEDLSKITL